jgi:predicted CoA-binding protein
MSNKLSDDELIKQHFKNAKTIAMVGVSSIKKEDPANLKRRPSTIVMKYLQEFGYKVIPVNPFSTEKEIYGEKVFKNLEDINIPIDIVNVFRPSAEAVKFAEEAVKVRTKVFWLQYGIQNEEAEKIIKQKNITYVSNKCIKQEYQKLFLKMNPVFPALKN